MCTSLQSIYSIHEIVTSTPADSLQSDGANEAISQSNGVNEAISQSDRVNEAILSQSSGVNETTSQSDE